MSALESLAFPPGASARGRPWSGPGVRGRVYGPLAPELGAAAQRWLASLTVPEGQALKPPDVFRVGAHVVKLFRQPSLLGWLRPPRAVRSAERHFWCLPLRSPRPLLAAGRILGRPSLLVREHVEGRLLGEVWGTHASTEAEAKLARFLATMERLGIAHGDLHPCNLLWTGEEWVLLDPDGLRHGLHDAERVRVGQWARLLLNLADPARVEALFRASAADGGPAAPARAGSGARARVQWQAVLEASARLRARRERSLARTGPRP